jgi:hypothetical protein
MSKTGESHKSEEKVEQSPDQNVPSSDDEDRSISTKKRQSIF